MFIWIYLKKIIKKFIKNNKLTLTSQQRFRSQKYNVFPDEVNKTALNANNDKRLQSIDSIETYMYEQRPTKDLLC